MGGPGCQGVGCKANGVDQDCAWCVYDDAACRAAYGDACGQTEAARAAQNADCSKKELKSQAACSGTTAGQKMIWVPGCQGVGCKANGVDQDCAWCVYDDAACRAAYGSACQQTEAARAAQNADCSKKELKSQAACSGTTAGQKMIWVAGCQGTGCKANGVDQDCAWCVYDYDACYRAYGSACQETENARSAQNAYCPPEQTPVLAA